MLFTGYGMALQNLVIISFLKVPSTLYKSPILPPPKHPRPSHSLHHAWLKVLRYCSSIFSFVLHLTNVLLFDPKTSNLDSSIHNTFFQPSGVQCLCSFAHLSLLFLLASLRRLFLAILPWSPASWSHLFTVDADTGVWRVLFIAAASWGSEASLS